MEKERRILVIGATNTDIAGECFFPMVLEDSNIGSVSTSLGGVGHNIALNASSLGASVTFITALGNDVFGRNAIKEMEGLMDISHSIFSSSRSGVYLYVTDEKGDMHVAVNDMAIVKEITASFLDENRKIIEDSPVVIVDANLESETIAKASSLSRGLVLADAVSTLKAERVVQSLGNIDILKPNIMELEFLSGMKIEDRSSLKRAAWSLLDRGVGAILATDGRKGAYFISSDTFLHSGIGKVEVKNTNGAGDAFLAGFAYAYSADRDAASALAFASASASITAGSEETVSGEINADLVYGLAKEIEIEKIS